MKQISLIKSVTASNMSIRGNDLILYNNCILHLASIYSTLQWNKQNASIVYNKNRKFVYFYLTFTRLNYCRFSIFVHFIEPLFYSIRNAIFSADITRQWQFRVEKKEEKVEKNAKSFIFHDHCSLFFDVFSYVWLYGIYYLNLDNGTILFSTHCSVLIICFPRATKKKN